MDSISHAEDDITHVYLQILKINNRLKDKTGMLSHERDYWEGALQTLCAGLINNACTN